MRFLKRTNLQEFIGEIIDPRDPQKTKYKKELCFNWAFSVFFFRCESLNALQTAFQKLPQHRRNALWHYFGLDKGETKLPDRSVITNLLSVIEYEEMNELLEKLFNWTFD
jgi:hypothetical protein